MDLILENVRSFAGEHVIPLSPLTFVTGENSSGKSTLLGMISAVSAGSAYPLHPSFDDEPYNLGSFDTIATSPGGKNGHAKHFSVGFKVVGRGTDMRVCARYVRAMSGDVALSHLDVETIHGRFTVERNGNEVNGFVFEPTSKGLGPPIKLTSSAAIWDRMTDVLSPSAAHGMLSTLPGAFIPTSKDPESWIRMGKILRSAASAVLSARSIAPIRTRPRRTYDRTTRSFSPEGDHVPYLLANMSLRADKSESDRERLEAILAFGREADLFQDLSIRALGTADSDPFQVQVTPVRRPVNLRDVGYGVSQSLPVVAEAVMADRDEWLLMQQPEVHLHPKAQAALGSFFARLVVGGSRMVVETHSDYIIDRVRQEVALGTIPAEAVTILYLERDGYKTLPHAIRLSAGGNIVDPPPSYRDFFLHEQINLFQRTAE